MVSELDDVGTDGHLDGEAAVGGIHVGGHVESLTVNRCGHEGEGRSHHASVGSVAVTGHVLEDMEGHGMATGVQVEACGFRHLHRVAHHEDVVVRRRVVHLIFHDANVVDSCREVEQETTVLVRRGLPHNTVG